MNGVVDIQRLARAKILQAFLDLASNSIANKNNYRDAQYFIFEDDDAIEFWCFMADISVREVRVKATQIMSSGLSWRAKSGQGKYYLRKKLYKARLKVRELLLT